MVNASIFIAYIAPFLELKASDSSVIVSDFFQSKYKCLKRLIFAVAGKQIN